ncbi:RNA 2',3'-cyclic phosphodiesterase [candidate division KSB1 bacterium]|nr:RNA 2',3'-cyclic phosphodiesterase [candidate division KSB1 bacterium]
MTKGTVRAFICFEIDQHVSAALGRLIDEGRALGERISWSKPEKIHLTLKFLGDIENAQVEQVSQIVRQLAEKQREFKLTIDKLGAFPNFQRPRVFWVGTTDVPAELNTLVTELEDALAQIGFARERRAFAPHLTLGRAKSDRCAQTAGFLKTKQLESRKVHCAELVLMKSDLQPSGAVYTPLATFDLQPGKHV